MTVSTWLIGALVDMPDQSVTIDGSGETVTASKSSIYLTHISDTTLSLLGQMVVAMASAGVADPGAELLRNRKVRLFSSGTFTVSWVSTQLQEALGYTGNLSGASSYEASNVSTLLWSPSRPENRRRGVLGSSGARTYNHHVHVTEDREVNSVTYGSAAVIEEFAWNNVPQARWDTLATGVREPGTLERFYENVLLHAQWNHHRVDEDDTASTTATLTDVHGPYRKADRKTWLENSRSRGFQNVECYYQFGMRAIIVPEYT